MKSKGNGGKRSRRGSEPALSARTCRGSAPKTSSRAVLVPLSTPHFAERLPRIKIPIPRYVRIRKGSVVNICFSHHRNFVIGERLWRPVRIRNRQLYYSIRVVTAGRYRKSQSLDSSRAPLRGSKSSGYVLLWGLFCAKKSGAKYFAPFIEKFQGVWGRFSKRPHVFYFTAFVLSSSAWRFAKSATDFTVSAQSGFGMPARSSVSK